MAWHGMAFTIVAWLGIMLGRNLGWNNLGLSLIAARECCCFLSEADAPAILPSCVVIFKIHPKILLVLVLCVSPRSHSESSFSLWWGRKAAGVERKAAGVERKAAGVRFPAASEHCRKTKFTNMSSEPVYMLFFLHEWPKCSTHFAMCQGSAQCWSQSSNAWGAGLPMSACVRG